MTNVPRGGASSAMHCLACKEENTRRASHDYFGAFDDDPDPTRDWDWYPMSPADAEALERFLVAHCPAPLDPGCGCALHADLENQVRDLPFAPWPNSPGDPLARSGYVHRTQVVIEGGAVRLVPACGARHSGDLVL